MEIDIFTKVKSYDEEEQSMNSTEKYEIFRSEILSLRCLKAMEFIGEVRGVTLATEIMPEGYLIEFSNQRNRSIRVKLMDVEGKGVVSIFVRNTENKEIFSLVSWLKFKNIDVAIRGFHLIDYVGDFTTRLHSFLGDLSLILSMAPLSAILLGDTWETVPFDWGGMR
ncbi:hypothetical protein INH39_23040 [Massilia violaceinigra]|uniref:Uncharacterized protein n=1 Tax=Massilia violaceinigra TaxID=2045208 RepID=A0ABY4A0M8_9BURK|nr:hypothetical protein [Massilia violaceinigra]UOD28310.1 hypothetical protein INH39_23040 [Massilia violaceinigra]